RRGRGLDDQHRLGLPHHRPGAEDVPREGDEVNEHLIQLSYFAAAVLFILSLRWLNSPHTARRPLCPLIYFSPPALFILSLRWLNSPKTARRGVLAGVAGMAAAIVGTLLAP